MPSVVKVQKDEAGYHLLRDGKPYVIKGGGGDVPRNPQGGGRELVADLGRGRPGAAARPGAELGLTVTIGIWLGQDARASTTPTPVRSDGRSRRHGGSSAAIAATPPS